MKTDKNIAKGNKDITLPGIALLGTINSLTNIGISPERILSKWGIKKIQENQEYSSDIRVALHDEAHKIYGDQALFAFGYANTLKWISLKDKRWTIDDPVNGSIKSLKNHMEEVRRVMGDSSKTATKIYDGRYGASLSYQPAGIFNYKYTQANCLRHHTYVRGMMDCLLVPLFKYWDYKIRFIRSKSKEGDHWAEFLWKIEFKPRKKKESINEIKVIRRLEVEQEFVKVVLRETQKQRNQVEKLSVQLGKYLPPQIHKSILEEDSESRITTRRKKLTIFFSDIANFTSTSEGLQPEDLTNYLNEYFSEMTAIALEFGATIDKYIGDAMMVFFGDPDSKGERNDARSCVEMALTMQQRMKELQDKWSKEGFSDPFQVRMGINTGYCNVGNFGSEQRLTYTIIGGEVNVAQRLESSADADGILMSYETYAHAQDVIEVEERETIKMKGISREIKIFSVKGRKNIAKVKSATDEKKPTKQELSEMEKMKKDISRIENNLRGINKNMERLLKKL
ncbi:MAG: hypothetical protein CMK56_06180 [Proteobacteria bacterium]|nr:hypothetical protein [Pseudomonadota bacterium]